MLLRHLSKSLVSWSAERSRKRTPLRPASEPPAQPCPRLSSAPQLALHQPSSWGVGQAWPKRSEQGAGSRTLMHSVHTAGAVLAYSGLHFQLGATRRVAASYRRAPSLVELHHIWPNGVQVACDQLRQAAVPHSLRPQRGQQRRQLVVQAVGAAVGADAQRGCTELERASERKS